MIVPRYWSESKTRKVVDGRQFTIKRFGWSDLSEQDAKTHANTRLQEAVNTLDMEGDVRRVDHKRSYNGAEGIPIREEVIRKERDVVISRNAYGALCLNTPDVLFADIDLEHEIPFRAYVIALISLSLCAGMASLYFDFWAMYLVSIITVLAFTSTVANLMHRVLIAMSGGLEKRAMDRIRTVSKENPELHLRLYRTPNGFRALLMNDTFSPTSEDTISLLKRLKSDNVYIRMCKNQNCFRARVSPKPWRIGVERIKPQPGVWPVKEERMPERRAWVDRYEKKAETYSSCRFLMRLGSDSVAEKAEFVRKLHDELGKVNAELKSA
ncbi:MAG: hypothetical protein GY703_01790 [Gammaproteobacteria bacterium]|nr:hypothetical protein [Gammaproteobacteria bacterium]